MKKNEFGGAIWTDHALDRIKERGIPKEYATEALKNPDSVSPSKEKGVRLIKQIEDKKLTLIVKRNTKSESVVLSIWMDPPMFGTKDYKNKQRYDEYKKGSLGKKFWLSILKQLGL